MTQAIEPAQEKKGHVPMKVAIRVDSSWQIGTGHVMRCLVLAKKLLEKGHEVKMVSRVLKGNLIDFCQSEGVKVIPLPVVEKNHTPSTKQKDLPHSHWLETAQEIDLNQSIIALSVFRPDWLICDHYALDSLFEHAIAATGIKILVIDDLADRQHECHILLDQNPFPHFETRYQNLIPETSLMLLGPKYALLRENFYQLRNNPEKIKNQVFVFFSGTDPTGENLKFIKACQHFESLPFQIKMIYGMENTTKNEILSFPQPDFLVCFESLPDFDSELCASRYAIGSAGVNAIERACLKIPSTLVCLANNQRPMAEHLAKTGLYRYLGEGQNTRVEDYIEEITWLCENLHAQPHRLEIDDIDALGCERVVSAMEEIQ